VTRSARGLLITSAIWLLAENGIDMADLVQATTTPPPAEATPNGVWVRVHPDPGGSRSVMTVMASRSAAVIGWRPRSADPVVGHRVGVTSADGEQRRGRGPDVTEDAVVDAVDVDAQGRRSGGAERSVIPHPLAFTNRLDEPPQRFPRRSGK
jgi:hypothetical protein